MRRGRKWLLVVVLSVVMPTAAYLMPPFAAPTNPAMQALAWLLWPGLAAYFLLGGNLFDGGFGRLGDAVIIVGVSALVWCAALAACLGLRAWVRARRTARGDHPHDPSPHAA